MENVSDEFSECLKHLSKNVYNSLDYKDSIRISM